LCNLTSDYDTPLIESLISEDSSATSHSALHSHLAGIPKHLPVLAHLDSWRWNTRDKYLSKVVEELDISGAVSQINNIPKSVSQ